MVLTVECRNIQEHKMTLGIMFYRFILTRVLVITPQVVNDLTNGTTRVIFSIENAVGLR